MPEILPLKGILYNPEKVPDLKEVITPPFDVISPSEQDEYHERHPQNMIRLVLGKTYPQDTEDDNRYTRAARSFRSWLDAGILRQDSKPAFYVTEIDFKIDGEDLTRFGFISRVRLERFETGAILPHEKTFSSVKADRRKLMDRCKANFSPIFSMFPDPDGQVVESLRRAIKPDHPDLQFTDIRGYRHRLWRVTHEQVHQEVGRRLAQRPLYLADGHHRYETALRYRDSLLARQAALGPDAPCNFVMMSLSSMHGSGVAIRPVHRLLCGVGEQAVDGFVDASRACFDIQTLSFDETDRHEVEKVFLSEIKKGADKQVIGVALHNHPAFYVLQVKGDIAEGAFSQSTPEPLKKLDVTVATQLVLKGILGLDGAALDEEQRVVYSSRADKALKAVREGKCPIALILNPTKLDQIREVSDAGLVMPRKSTYFYPKVMTGLVINKLDD